MSIEVILDDGNIDHAIKRLKKMVAVDGILFQLKMRSLYPNKRDLEKAKAARAQLRNKRSERRKEAAIRRQRG